MPPSLNKTVLICRPKQLREAAILLSCIGGAGTVLLSVMEPPPLTRREYDDLYDAYTEARQASLKNVVGAEYLGTTKDMAEIRAAIDRHNELRCQLTSPRSWLTHGRRWSELFAALPCERAVILFAPNADDLTIWANVKAKNELVAESAETVLEFEDQPLLPAGAKIITFIARPGSDLGWLKSTNYTYEGLDELSQLAWSVFRNHEASATAELADSCEVGSILLGLRNALKRNVPLQIHELRERTENRKPIRQSEANNAECVLVEAADTASSLAGVIYAHHKGLSLFVCKPPDERRIQSAIDGFRECQRQARWAARLASRHIDEVSVASDLLPKEKAAILKAAALAGDDDDSPHEGMKGTSIKDIFRRYILGDWQKEAMLDIERAVNAHLQSEIVSAIGERPITAFTVGVPYHFVHMAGSDWSHRAIGHVASDGPLMVATDLCLSQRPSPTAPYAAIFDPGFFRTSETRDVVAAMDGHSAHCLVFTKAASGLHGLKFSASFPLELVFFNTHGTDHAIVLGDFAVTNQMLVQWVKFSSTPVVFNNSCLSWTGVGREFVRVGARAYIGTLWPVNAETAAMVATKAMKAMAEGIPIAAAIRDTTVDEETKMAYIYAGMADSRILARGDVSEERRKQYVLEATECLLDALLVHGPRLVEDQDTPLVRYAYSELGAFFERPELKAADPRLLYRLRVKQLLVLASNFLQSGVSKEYAAAVASECFRLHEAWRDLDPAAPDERGRIFDARAQIRRQSGDISGAIEDLEASAKAPPTKGHDDLIARLNIANLLKIAGYWNEAMGTAVTAKREADQRNHREARMRLAGLLGQLERRQGLLAAALAHADEGFTLSVELQNRMEQAEFSLDRARIHLALGEPDAAIIAANEASEIARPIMDVQHVLNSQGLLSGAYTQKKEWGLARQAAEQGLMMAVSRNDIHEQAAFVFNLGAVSEGEGNLPQAIETYRRSMILAARSGHTEDLRSYAQIANLALQTGNWPQISTVLEEQLVAHANLPFELRKWLLVRLIEMLRRAVFIGSRQDVLSGLARVAERCEMMLKMAPNDPGGDWRLASLTAGMLIHWLRGSPAAMDIARDLDEKWTDGGFHWQDFISLPPPALQ